MEESVSTSSDAGRLFQAVEENVILKEQVQLLKDKLALKEQELAIKDQLIALEEKRVKMYQEALEQEKALTDRALKLAEQSKTNIYGVLAGLGLIAIIVAVIAAAF